MVTDIKTFFTSEMATLKADLGMLEGRIKAMEDTVQSFGLKQQSADTHLLEVSSTCAALSAKVEHLEDLARQRNIKIWGIPDIVDVGELPHYIRRLFAASLTPKQAKGLQHDGYTDTSQGCDSKLQVTIRQGHLPLTGQRSRTIYV
ncbi:Hypothetical predicted protein [Pelobates cultripes]|uniref:Uncharacterized protein n=1 Tax=Pelobates cultripes TaxID=61616 RepID=A0AAD1REQ6_PELCU|nr:Hypothetical predicted protein [Pelobates cultripes]